MILVTGGAGFIGSNFILEWVRKQSEAILNVDKLTYAGNLHNLDSLDGVGEGRYVFVREDIGNQEGVAKLLAKYRPRAVVNFAAESHVDRSIHAPEAFVQTNVLGTYRLLEATNEYWKGLAPGAQRDFRFLHVSTDEVYGSLGADDSPFRETTAYAPNSPYSASKASSDHLVRAYFHTYGLPTLTTNCSNNYGPYQFPEKLIPLVIHNAIAGKALPVYGDGRNVRDWLFVADHCMAIHTVLRRGVPGETYNIGGNSERTNIDVVRSICHLLDELAPTDSGIPHDRLITFVKDRPGHDRRYAIDATKISGQLGWRPEESFEGGLRKTVQWYLANQAWVANVTSGEYRHWMSQQYSPRRDS